MRDVSLILSVPLLLVPASALACVNTIAREVIPTAHALEFLHFGVGLAALVLMRWSGQLSGDEAWEPDLVLGPDELLPRDEPLKNPRRSQPTVVRQYAILAVCAVLSLGFGVIMTDEATFVMTDSTIVALAALGLVAAAVALSLYQRASMILAFLRRSLLAIAILVAMLGGYQAWSVATS